MSIDSLIRLENVSVKRQRTILHNVDLNISRGEIITVIGPNGAGKSTLVRVAVGLLKPTTGKRLCQAKLKIGYMPQKLQIEQTFPLTVKRFLQLGLNSKDSLTLAKSALTEVNAAHIIDSPIQSISGGELQRTMLARALMRKPDLLVLDEPVQGVDIAGQQALYQLIGHIRDRYQCGILMVSHDLHLVMASTDHVICLNQHICCSGHPEKVTNDPAYHELFGKKANPSLALYTHHHDHHHHLDGHIITDQQEVQSQPRKTDD